jgi:hypothetical protein
MRGVVARPEQLDELAVRGDRWIVDDLDRLRVISEAVVRRRLLRAARVADTRGEDAAMTPELGVGSPESAEREDGVLVSRKRDSIEREEIHGGSPIIRA